jgi:uncharacterized membrane protein YebE (DUF533 family)
MTMNYREIADLLLQSSQELAQKGQTMAQQQLQLPPEGPEREAFLQTLGKSAAAGGLLAMLLGTGIGRKLTGSALKVGSLAALGTVAYNAYQKWQGQAATGRPIDQLSGPEAAARSLALLKAMVSAAKADGHIDSAERARIENQLAALSLDADTLKFFKEELAKPLDAKAVAVLADSPVAAAEIYLTSLLVIDDQNDPERAYLQSLARELKLAPELLTALEDQAKA